MSFAQGWTNESIFLVITYIILYFAIVISFHPPLFFDFTTKFLSDVLLLVESLVGMLPLSTSQYIALDLRGCVWCGAYLWLFERVPRKPSRIICQCKQRIGAWLGFLPCLVSYIFSVYDRPCISYPKTPHYFLETIIEVVVRFIHWALRCIPRRQGTFSLLGILYAFLVTS